MNSPQKPTIADTQHDMHGRIMQRLQDIGAAVRHDRVQALNLCEKAIRLKCHGVAVFAAEPIFWLRRIDLMTQVPLKEEYILDESRESLARLTRLAGTVYAFKITGSRELRRFDKIIGYFEARGKSDLAHRAATTAILYVPEDSSFLKAAARTKPIFPVPT